MGLKKNNIVNACKKVAYKTRAVAIEALTRINSNPKILNKMTYAYKCENCRMWHLTSMNKERHNAIVSCKKKRDNTINPDQNFIAERLKFLLSKNKMKKK